MTDARKITLPKTVADVKAMNVEEFDKTIGALRRLQRSPSLLRRNNHSLFGLCATDPFSRLQERKSRYLSSGGDGFAEDARKLRGDWENVGRDMWIGVLKHEREKKA